MPKSIAEIIAELDAFQAEDVDNEGRLHGVLEGLRALANCELAMESMFTLMERFPEADFGSPGPLVHELEAMGGYQTCLRASLKRMPTDLTVWTVNRILNSDIDAPARQTWLSELREVARRSDAPKSARESAFLYLRHQANRENT